MSQTGGTGEATRTLTIIETLELRGHTALSAIQHAAKWLVGTAATESINLHDLVGSNAWVQQAWASGVKSAEAHGVPVVAMENAGEAVLAAAKDLAAGLAAPPPAIAPAGAPAAAA
jgi:hypothetical protein